MLNGQNMINKDKVSLKKLIQYAKLGSCDKNTPYPSEVLWIKLGNVKDDKTRITPENLLTVEEVEAMLIASKHPMHKALISLAYETSARPGELLTMKIGSIKFEKEHLKQSKQASHHHKHPFRLY